MDTANSNFDTEQIKQKAVFFGKTDNLTQYQKQVNLASIELCLTSPSLLLGKRGDLLALAKDKVHEDGYQYKRERVVLVSIHFHQKNHLLKE